MPPFFHSAPCHSQCTENNNNNAAAKRHQQQCRLGQAFTAKRDSVKAATTIAARATRATKATTLTQNLSPLQSSTSREPSLVCATSAFYRRLRQWLRQRLRLWLWLRLGTRRMRICSRLSLSLSLSYVRVCALVITRLSRSVIELVFFSSAGAVAVAAASFISFFCLATLSSWFPLYLSRARGLFYLPAWQPPVRWRSL